MPAACLVYLATINPRVDRAAQILQNEIDTRNYAARNITGRRVIARTVLFEIMEGPHAQLEAILDQHIENTFINEPEILLHAPIAEHQFRNWSHDCISQMTARALDFEPLHSIAHQAFRKPDMLPAAAKLLLEQFCTVCRPGGATRTLTSQTTQT